MALLFRQILALVQKDLLLLFNPKTRTFTVIRAFTFPIIFAIYMSIILKVYWPKENYGVGTPNRVLSLQEGMQSAKGGRNTLVLVNSVSRGGDIDRVIELISQPVRSLKTVQVLRDENELVQSCHSTLQGTTKCYGAVVFHSSPSEGPGGLWNYTLRADASFGTNINVEKTTNDPEVYQLPLQRAVDAAIASVNSTGDATALPSEINKYPFTSKTQKEWRRSIVTSIQSANTNYLSIVWYVGFIGVMYQLVGLIAKERETGISDLVESMMPNVNRWEPQLARLVAHHIAFTIAYSPGWIVMAIMAKLGVYPETSAGILVVFFILAGLALVSCSILGASFFRKAQLSGISTVVIVLALGIAAQIESKNMSSGTVVVLGLLFNPMTFVFFLSGISRFEKQKLAASLTHTAPGSHWTLPPIILWVLLIMQIFLYPMLAIYVERWLYGTASKRSRRNVSWNGGEEVTPIQLDNFKKVYQHNRFLRFIASIFRIKLVPVTAVDGISLTALKGQILVLVGANGCGKTTMLSAIAGLTNITDGSISIDGSGGIGLCPQKNVLWNGLSVEQHAQIFYKLKTVAPTNSTDEVNSLIALCGLEDKRKAAARTLSGGQKRKLQLIMMLIGGSRVCCVDEVSGGLDPISRRRIWDILLAERGRRTFILTTHFLDEAEYLADDIAIISTGKLKAQGSTSELKARLGNGYRFSMAPGADDTDERTLIGLSSKLQAEQTFSTQDPAVALEKIKSYKREGIKNYQIAGPTIEEVFMKLAADTSEHDHHEKVHDVSPPTSHSEKGAMVVSEDELTTKLLTGRRISSLRQASILFKKRITLLRWSWLPYAAAVIIPIIAAALITLLLKNFKNPGCAFREQVSDADIETLSKKLTPQLVVGPPDLLSPQTLRLFSKAWTNITAGITNVSSLVENVHLVNTLDEFNKFAQSNYTTIVPGGLFVGKDGVPTYNYRSDIGTLSIYSAIFMQNAMDVLLSNQTIVTQYAVFDLPWPPKTEYALQFVFYFGLVMAAYPAFFALYPTTERLNGIRALQYSNGVRSLPLWLAYLAFDGTVVLFVSAIMSIIFVAAVPHAFYNIGYLFFCLFLYGIASTLLSYAISLIAKSQLAAFAFSAGGQAFMLLMYMTAYMNITAQTEASKVQSQILIVHYTLGLITPIGQLLRAIIVSLNLLNILCVGYPPTKSTNPGLMNFYGAPIVYLIGQSLFLFGIFVWADHDFAFIRFSRRNTPIQNVEDQTTKEPEVSEEIQRVINSDDGLRMVNVSKTYTSWTSKKVAAVDDLTLGVKHGEVFALVGPNGAGKSTTISLIRGETHPNRGSGPITIQSIPVATSKEVACSHLGVCPQNDALDKMTVLEHLRFYAGIRGVKDIECNVRALVEAVGLKKFENRMAGKLSGGNKRKLSLGIALIGNPEVLLLDEPSSGMDPFAKRSMWKTLSRFVPNRSILLTTHSMEEADILASRVGVLSKHMLDIGTTSHLRNKHGYGFHIHLVLKSAPFSTTIEIEELKSWIESCFPGAEMERDPYHGQLRFNIPSSQTSPTIENVDEGEEGSTRPTKPSSSEGKNEERSIGTIFTLLEENKEERRIDFYSISLSTFDEVFLKVVGRHGINEDLEETRNAVPQRRKWWVVGGHWAIWLLFPWTSVPWGRN